MRSCIRSRDFWKSRCLLLAMGLSLGGLGTVGNSADDLREDGPDITGVWKLYGQMDADGTVTQLSGEAAQRTALKFFMSGRWCVTFADPDGQLLHHHGGTYKLDGNEYSESIEFTGRSSRALLNKTLHFEVDVEGDTFTQIGLDNPYSEVWKRVKNDDE